ELVEALAAAQQPTKWVNAAHAVATDDSTGAAPLYAEIGSRPDEALARLRGVTSLLKDSRDEPAALELEVALEFFRAVDATRYIREAETLARTTPIPRRGTSARAR